MKAKALSTFIFVAGFNLFVIQFVRAQDSAAPQTITGTVLEEGTENPIPKVSVFFDGTMNGTSTDSVGNFTLDAGSTSKTVISVTAVGYFSKTISDYSPDVKLVIHLKARAYTLSAVEISPYDGLSRKDKMKVFKREFLGDNENGRNCIITNEDDIRVTYNTRTNTYRAFCDNPIIIVNRNLGYVINFQLESFTCSDDGTFFTGTQFYKQMDISPSDLKQIEKNRKEAYLGSRMHFIRSLWNNKLRKNNFRIYRVLGEATYNDLVVSHDGRKYMNPTETMQIVYKWRKSKLYKNSLGKEIYIDQHGYNNPAGVSWGGDIGDQRVGNALPLEYDYDLSISADQVAANGINSFIPAVDTMRSRMPAEKLYIQFDKPYYNSGDTLRLKAYLFEASMLRGSESSGLVHIELANDSNQVVLRRLLPVGYGLGAGSIVLSKSEIPEGGYTLRAYTNLMLNFGDDEVFTKHFYVSGAAKNMLVNATSVISRQSGKDNLRWAIRFNQFDQKAIAFRDMDLRVQQGKKILFKDRARTDVDGQVDVSFSLPEKTSGNNISIVVGDGKTTPVLTIPVQVNRPENTDLQFMPEGGNLVAGITSRVGFKAIGEDGNTVEVSGKIYNSDNQEVAVFKSAYRGMGSFELTPKSGEKYTAKLALPDGGTKNFALPAVKGTGTVLGISNSEENEWISVIVSIASNVPQPASYYLIAQSSGKVVYNEVVRFDGNTTFEDKIEKDRFYTGIVRFTLFNTDRRPLNERITFIDHNDNLNISVKPDKDAYATRDSIALAIEVTDVLGNPVQGTFSMAVTDDSQVKTDTLSNNIQTDILLTSGLKGDVEEPGHYFQQTAQSKKDRDNLLLTQGWVGYDWKDVFDPPSDLKYPSEYELIVQGKIINKPKKADSINVQLLSVKPPFITALPAERDGSFSFSGFPVADNLHFFIQARDKKNHTVEVQLNTPKPPVFKPAGRRYLPWYVNSDTTLLRQASTQQAVKEVRDITRGSNLLEEVVIAEKKIIPGSKNLNGPGESDQTLDEKDMASMPKKTLLDVMQEKIKGFNIGLFPTRQVSRAGLVSQVLDLSNGQMVETGKTRGTSAGAFLERKQSYKIGEKEVHLVIDGIDIEQFYIPDASPSQQLAPTATEKINMSIGAPPPEPAVHMDYISLRNAASPFDRMQFIKSYLNNIKAEDIKGIEVMVNPQYNSRYKTMFSSKILVNLDMITTDFAFVEVTTYSGNGAFLKKPLGGSMFNPIPYTSSASFYRPKYISKTSPVPDLRSTIHWEPDIITDNEGKAVVSFYSADRPGTYSVTIEGTNMNGFVGTKRGTVTIKN